MLSDDSNRGGQAAGLITAFGARKPVQVIAVTSGKGGVGKTSVSTNLAVCLAESGRKTLLFDADLGMANVDVLLGLVPQYTLWDVLQGRCDLDQTLIEGPSGLRIVPATSGKRAMAELSPAEHVGLIRAFSELKEIPEIMVIDTAAGISDSVLTFSQAAQDVIVVVCDEPASITDAYALIKVLNRERDVSRIHVIANMVRSPSEGEALFAKLARVCERFLDVTVDYLAAIPHDEWMRRAIQRQQVVVEAYPAAPSAMAFRSVIRHIDKWRPAAGLRGHIEFFVEHLAQEAGVAA
jgi:flagellar biosynthesis protein FlhG